MYLASERDQSKEDLKRAEQKIADMAALVHQLEKPKWSNPKYDEDLSILDGNETDFRTLIGSVIGKRTVVIVVGVTCPAELLDRPVAYKLRDQIDKKAHSLPFHSPFHRGIVITDWAWSKHEEFLKDKPLIAIGGEDANRIAAQMLARREKPTEWTMGEKIWGGPFPVIEQSTPGCFVRRNGISDSEGG